MPSGFVYILASKRNGTLYLGVTSDLIGRIQAHRDRGGSAFVKKYAVTASSGLNNTRFMSTQFNAKPV